MKNVTKLAYYATFKTLYGNNYFKSYYELVSNFIKHIIIKYSLYSFDINDICLELEKEYDFNLPIAIVRKSIKKIDYITIIEEKCVVDTTSKLFKKDKNDYTEVSIDKYDEIIKDICNFAKNDYKKTVNVESITSELIAFLIDDEENVYESNNNEIISRYILSVENDKSKQNILASIREGGIIYMGLNSNISDIGALTNRITLYLDTEILFNLVGYNGEYFKYLANDMMKQINIANKRKKVIELKYFEGVKNEIETFFNTAEEIVENKKIYEEKVAMTRIINGCENISDVLEKKAKFYYDLEKMGIYEDDNTNYYIEDNHKYCIESKSELKKSNEYAENIEYLCKINILRKNKKITKFEDVDSIFITETKYAIELSKEFIENDSIPLAINTSKITNMLWCKLGTNFGCDDYPKNLKVIIKAKTVLTNLITNKISKEFENNIQKFKNKEITKELLEKQIIVLHEKVMNLDNLDYSNVDDLMNFSKKYFDSYESKIELKNKEIEEVKNNYQEYVKDAGKEISEKNIMIDNLERELENKNIIMNRYEKIEMLRCKICSFIKSIEKYFMKKKKAIIYTISIVVITIVLMLFIDNDTMDIVITFGALSSIVIFFIPFNN